MATGGDRTASNQSHLIKEILKEKNPNLYSKRTFMLMMNQNFLQNNQFEDLTEASCK